MKKPVRILALFFVLSFLLSGCTDSVKFQGEGTKNSPVPESSGTESASPGPTPVNTPAPNTDITDAATPSPSKEPPIDLSVVKPNEAGKIMVVMFHNFVESYKSGDKEYTTTFDDFRNLLQTLYDMDYRLISLDDYLNHNISVPAGCIPMVFTFDDGTPGQFNLVEENGILVANRRSAVGIMEEFNKIYPDFGLKGVFYVNLDLGTFKGQGTLEERLKYLIEKGFEIGNHTLTHAYLPDIRDSAKIQKEIGGNQKKMYELIPGYKMNSFSLPFGMPSKDLRQYIEKGEHEGVAYENLAVMEVGSDPAPSPVSVKFNPLSTPRVRAQGIEPVNMDLTWWLKNLSREQQYISDGNPDTVTVPKNREGEVDRQRLGTKRLILY